MRLTPAQAEQAAQQLEARPVPENGRITSDLERWFGDHTFFLSGAGLHIVEPENEIEPDAPMVRFVKVASWTDSNRTSLTAHEPQATDVAVALDSSV